MVSTTKNVFVENEEPKVTKGCKPSYDKQRAQIGGGYLICNICFEEIPNN